MGLITDAIRKIFPSNKSERSKIRYKIKIYEDTFEIFLNFSIRRTLYTAALEKLSKIYNKDIGMLNVWEADKRVLEKVKPEVGKIVKDIYDDVKKDLPDFTIVDYDVESMVFKKNKSYVNTFIHIKGYSNV